LVAEAAKMRRVLGWRAELDDLGTICSTACQWELNMQKSSPDRRRNVAA
jgi:UDP-glucose 4-epimerase